MTEPARNYQTIKTTALDGLQDLFSENIGQAQPTAQEAQDQAHVSVAQAAKMLQLDRRYVLRLAHKGKLSGYRDANNHWFISVDSIENRLGLAQAKSDIKVGQAQIAEARHQEPAAMQETFCTESPLGLDHVEVVQAQDQAQVMDAEPQEDFRDILIRELQTKNETLTWRNGYLEAQLEQQREEIKLLTDCQHKPQWWARLAKWFSG